VADASGWGHWRWPDDSHDAELLRERARNKVTRRCQTSKHDCGCLEACQVVEFNRNQRIIAVSRYGDA